MSPYSAFILVGAAALILVVLLGGCAGGMAGVVMTEDGRAIMVGKPAGSGWWSSESRVRPSPLPAPIEPGHSGAERKAP